MSSLNLKLVNESGRPWGRWICNGVLGAVGLALAIAFLRWAFGSPFPEIPGQGILIASLPYAQSMWDNFVRSKEKAAVASAQFGNAMPNLHGGPAAP